MSLVESPLRCSILCLPMCLGIMCHACSDPAVTTASGAFAATFGDGTTGTCAPMASPGPNLAIGSVNGLSKSLLSDADGVSVTCTVVPSGDGYSVSARISGNNITFSINTVAVSSQATDSQSASVVSPSTLNQVWTESSGTPCQATLISGAPGQAWISFHCDDMTSGNPGDCTLYNGFLAVEGCSGS